MTFCETALAKMKQIQETMEAWSGGDQEVLSRLKNLVKASPCLGPFVFVNLAIMLDSILFCNVTGHLSNAVGSHSRQGKSCIP